MHGLSWGSFPCLLWICHHWLHQPPSFCTLQLTCFKLTAVPLQFWFPCAFTKEMFLIIKYNDNFYFTFAGDHIPSDLNNPNNPSKILSSGSGRHHIFKKGLQKSEGTAEFAWSTIGLSLLSQLNLGIHLWVARAWWLCSNQLSESLSFIWNILTSRNCNCLNLSAYSGLDMIAVSLSCKSSSHRPDIMVRTYLSTSFTEKVQSHSPSCILKRMRRDTKL